MCIMLVYIAPFVVIGHNDKSYTAEKFCGFCRFLMNRKSVPYEYFKRCYAYNCNETILALVKFFRHMKNCQTAILKLPPNKLRIQYKL